MSGIPIIVYSIIISVCLIDLTFAVTRSVYRVKYFGTTPQLVTSDTLFWETYTGDDKQLDQAVVAGKFEEATGRVEKLYVCRALLEGVYVPGNTENEGDRTVCKLSMTHQITIRPTFDILLNKGSGAKLVWTNWTKYSGDWAGITPLGAISASGIGHLDDPYVARNRIKHPQHTHHHILGRDYLIGRYERDSGLGKITVIDDLHVTEHNEGDILTETEPVRYELREIRINRFRRRVETNITKLASSVLKNLNADGSNMVETVITYTYKKEEYWGKIDGVATALPTDVYEGAYPTTVNWGIKNTQTIVETKPVSALLPPGTAVNVTVTGNFTKLEAQYNASLIAYYADNSDGVTRRIVGNVQKADLNDVEIEYGPIYWLHNNSFYPTTTTTTTTTTTPKTTTTALPITDKNYDVITPNDKENEIPRQMQVQVQDQAKTNKKKELEDTNSSKSISSLSLLTILTTALLLSLK